MAKSHGGVRITVHTTSIANNSNGALINTPRPETIQDFANRVIEEGVSRGKYIKIGNLNEVAQRELANMGIKLQSAEVLLTDDTVLKYVDHPKKAKGAAIPRDRYDKIKNVINNPKHIYQDIKQKNLVLVFSGKYGKGKILKVVIQPNFKQGKKVFNKAKSIGIVDAHHLNQQQYRKIK